MQLVVAEYANVKKLCFPDACCLEAKCNNLMLYRLGNGVGVEAPSCVRVQKSRMAGWGGWVQLSNQRPQLAAGKDCW